MAANIDRDTFLPIHSSLMSRLIDILERTKSENVKRHLHRGFQVRLAMIESSILELDRSTRNRTTPLDVYQTELLCVHLNSYYINIVGSLDNLAWALLYKLDIEGIDENKWKFQKLATLSNPDLGNLLIEKHFTILANLLAVLRGWILDLKEFRDPSAHRIPLLVSRSIFNESDIASHSLLDEEAARLIENGNHGAGMAKLNEAYSLGNYHPVFICENPSITPYHLASQLNRDHSLWLNTVSTVLDHAFSLA